MSKKDLWVILNVSEEAKSEAKKKAKLEKKNIGRWLSEYILTKEKKPDNSVETYKHLIAISDNIFTELDEIKLGIKAIYNQLNELNQRKDSPPKYKFFSKILK